MEQRLPRCAQFEKVLKFINGIDMDSKILSTINLVTKLEADYEDAPEQRWRKASIGNSRSRKNKTSIIEGSERKIEKVAFFILAKLFLYIVLLPRWKINFKVFESHVLVLLLRLSSSLLFLPLARWNVLFPRYVGA